VGRLIYTDPSGQELSVPFGPQAPVVRVGRAMDCTIRSNRKSVSRHHAEFRYHNGRYEVVDNGSSNGTYLIVNEERRQIRAPQQLAHEDEVWCGDFILRFYDEPADVDSTHERTGIDYPPVQSMADNDPYGSGRSAYDFGASPPPRQGYDHGYDMPAYGSPVDHGKGAANTTAPSHGGVNANMVASPPAGQSFTSRPFNAGIMESFDDLDAELIEVEPAVNDEVERLREEKNSIEELASRQAFELDDLRNRLRETQTELERVRDELDERASHTMVAPADLDRAKSELTTARSENQRLLDELESTRRKIEVLERLQDEAEDRDLRTVAAPGNLTNLATEMEFFKNENQRLSEERDEAKVKVGALERSLEEAYRKLEELRAAQPVGPDPEVARLTEELRHKQHDLELLEKEFDDLQHAFSAAEARAADQDEMDRLQAEVERLEEALAAAEARAADRSELDRLSAEVDRLQKALRATEGQKVDQDKLTGLQKEYERQGRLLEEFERRSRELKSELDDEIATSARLKHSLEDQTEKLEQLEKLDERRRTELETAQDELRRAQLEAREQIEALEGERDEARAEVARQQSEQQGHHEQVKDLKNEIEGLKMRLKLEKERSKSDEGLADENHSLRQRISELDGQLEAIRAELEATLEQHHVVVEELAAARQSVELSQAISPEFFAELRTRLETLERIMDAIERTDLQPLSTVDRIRLQSAIRDTKPRKTLEELRTMVQQQLEGPA
jgi:chromosome segregation ATPase